MIGVVLAAGAGTRLRPLSLTKPKALFPLLDRPVLSWRLGALASAGINRVCVNMHHHAPLLSAYLKEAESLVRMEVIQFDEQPEPLGTAGALKAMGKHLGSEFLITNADIVTDAPVGELIELHRRRDAAATLLVVPSQGRYPDVEVEDGSVVQFLGPGEVSETGWTYGCMAVFRSHLLDEIPEGQSGIYESIFSRFEESSVVAALPWNGHWRDIGTPASHLASNIEALSSPIDKLPPAAGAGPSRWDEQAYVGSGAEVEGAEIVRTVVGHAAVVDEGASLHSCVVWDHTWVPEGRYENCILTPAGITQV